MKLADAEWTILRALWDRSPSTAREVLRRIEDETGWAYTTVKTLLERLVAKGAVVATRDRTAVRYSARLKREAARRSALRALLDRAFDGGLAPLLQHIVAEERLSASDRARLRQLLRELDEGEGGGR